MIRSTQLTLAAIVALLAAPLAAQDYGTLTGTFVFSGTSPEAKKLDITKDVEVCGKMPLFTESLVVEKEGGLANIVICVLGDARNPNAPVANIHPDYAKLKGQKVTLDNKSCRFEPHVAKLWTAQKLELKNSDSIGHNSFGAAFNNPQFNPLIPAGGSVMIDLSKPERVPVKVTCSIHPWMSSYIVVRPDPYFDASATTGKFKIEKIPAGKHSILLWHEGLLYLNKIEIGGKAQTGTRGVHPVEVKAGDNDLGKIVVKAADYTTQIKKL